MSLHETSPVRLSSSDADERSNDTPAWLVPVAIGFVTASIFLSMFMWVVWPSVRECLP